MAKSMLFKSLGLVMVMFVAGGLPKIVDSQAKPVPHNEPLMLFAVTELKVGANGHYVVKADINNSSVTVLVDTGASTVALSYEDAERTGLKPRQLTYSIPVSTANGVTNAAPVTLRKVEINGVRVSDVPAVVLPKGAMKGTLLGMSFLSKLQSFKVEDGVLYLKQ